MTSGARITGFAGVALLSALWLAGTAGSTPIDDYRAVLADYRADATITPCRFTLPQLRNAGDNTPPEVRYYVPDFVEQVRAELRRHRAGGCPDRSRLATTLARPRVAARQVGGRIKVEVRGRIAKRGRTCNGKVAIAVRSAGRRRVHRRGTIRSSCRYATRLSFRVEVLPRRLRPRGARLRVKVNTRYAGTSARRPDSAPARIARVRR